MVKQPEPLNLDLQDQHTKIRNSQRAESTTEDTFFIKWKRGRFLMKSPRGKGHLILLFPLPVIKEEPEQELKGILLFVGS